MNETRVQFMADDEQQECEMIEFKVRAVSDLGDGEYGSVIAGFPIGMFKCSNDHWFPLSTSLTMSYY